MDKNIGNKPRDHHEMDTAFNNLQRLPTAPMVEAFSRSTLSARSSKDGQQEGREGKDWLKEKAFQYAERVLFAADASSAISIRDEQGRHGDSGEGGANEQGGQRGMGGAWRRMFLSLCRRMLEVRAMTELANQLSLCVRNSHHFDSAWQLEFAVSNRLLARTQVVMRCDPPALQLRFNCTEESAHRLLQDNVMLLHARLGSLSRHCLTVEIEMVDNVNEEAQL